MAGWIVTMVVASGFEPFCEGADVHSWARPEQVRVTRLSLDLTVDFAARALRGTATLTFARPDGSDPESPLILDTRALVIQGVREGGRDKGPAVPFTMGKPDPILGTPLEIRPGKGVTEVTVTYRTTEGASALQWLDPRGTAGGKAPFLFTQSQAIHARSWIPLQDSPAVRVRYDAKVTVPRGLTAVMSADAKGSTESPDGTTFAFEMVEAIPSYLIALAVGDLAFKPLGTRTGVWAEPGVVASAAAEFVDTERMVETTERRFGPYRWGRYDLLILPPSFPYGGMENPKLTFATPTVIAGDRSLVALVAHELAHSWSGNLVTNATWRDFWLNEGFTTYLERRIMEDLYGQERVAMEWVLGLQELKDELNSFPPGDQVLHVDLSGRDPDEGMTRVPYEKGALFLKTLEEAYGRATFDPFLKGYFDHFAFQSIKTEDFLAYLRANLLDKNPETARSIDLAAWIDKPGLPPGAATASSDRFGKVETAARNWASKSLKVKSLATGDWTTHEWLHFLRSLPGSLTTRQMAELDEAFGFTDRGNAEVANQWLILAVRHGYAPADARLESFLTTIGRRKFLIPLYAELLKTPAGEARARAIFAKARTFYHPIAEDSVARLLNVESR
ncbi:MAG: M1 family metallopeptidase [Isosphaeraceae bacterium]